MRENADLIRFDVERFLSSRHVDTRKVTRFCVNICCPFCPDTGFHCGIFLDYKNFSCWKCGRSGGLYTLFKELFGLSRSSFDELVSVSVSLEKGTNSVDQIREIFSHQKDNSISPQVNLPSSCIPVTEKNIGLYPLAAKFLRKRNISVDCCQQHNVQFCMAGDFAYRLIIPVEYEGEIVFFQARDMTDCDRVSKYLSEPKGVFTTDFLYGLDEFKGDRIILLEGVLDQWVLPSISVSCFGSSISEKQQSLILKTGASEIVFALDRDIEKTTKYDKLIKVMGKFMALGKRVKYTQFPKGKDPSSLGMDKTMEFVERSNDVLPGTLRSRNIQDHLLGYR